MAAAEEKVFDSWKYKAVNKKQDVLNVNIDIQPCIVAGHVYKKDSSTLHSRDLAIPFQLL